MSTADSRRSGQGWLKSVLGGINLCRMIAALVAVGITVWSIVIFRFDNIPFAALNPTLHGGIEAARSIALVFAAVALFLFPQTRTRDRMRWVAFGLIVLAVGAVVFNVVFGVFGNQYAANERLYASFVISTIASVLVAIGLLSARCPRLTLDRFLAGMTATLILVGLVLLFPEFLPRLSTAPLVDFLQSPGQTHLQELTAWHWVLSGIPVAILVVIFVRILQPSSGVDVPGWLVIAMVLFTGSHIHNILWPSIYSPIATSADVLRASSGGAVLIGAFLELRKVAIERADKLAEQEEYNRRLQELQILRADFTSMVAHELSNPLAAIRRYADVLRAGALKTEQGIQLVDGIQQETDLLRNLIADVHIAAAIEREDFEVNPGPVPLGKIIDSASRYAESVHGLEIVRDGEPDVQVTADAERINQVMRNLLANAARFSPPGERVDVLAHQLGRTVRISVRDYGPGINPADRTRIFEKFGRGTSAGEAWTTGLGLGLYISRRILRLHGTELTVKSKPSQGAEFSFELRIAQ